SIVYLENRSATAIHPALTVSDPDSANLVGARVAITANFAAGQDVLRFSDQNGIIGSYDAATGVLVLAGSSSVANYEAALRSVSYFNSSEDPSTAARTVEYQADDGSVLAGIGEAAIIVVAENDSPLFAAHGGGSIPVVTETVVAVAENATAVAVVTA